MEISETLERLDFSLLRKLPHLRDDETVAKMGYPVCGEI
jgi:hypothetical protein